MRTARSLAVLALAMLGALVLGATDALGQRQRRYATAGRSLKW